VAILRQTLTIALLIFACGCDTEAKRQQTKLAKLKREIALQQTQIMETNQAITTHKQTITSLRTQHTTQQKMLRDKEHQLQVSSDEIKALKQQLADTKANSADDGEIDRLTAARDRCEEKAQKMRTALLDAREKAKQCSL
jgi:septal ring factor EnvC (AmiA/AmiB activator)